MKILKKVILGVSAGVLSLAMYKGISANAGVLPPLTLDFVNQSFAFRNDGEGIVSFDAVKISGKGENAVLKWNPKAKWDSYDVAGNDREVDLSSQKPTKDLLIAIQDIGDASPIVFWVPADTSSYKGKYEFGSLTITDGGDKVEGNDLYQGNNAKFEYRTENGNWRDYNPDATDGTKFTMYEQQGATLYFRRKAVAADSSGYTLVRDKLSEELQPNVASLIKVKGSYFASREFKVKIPKKSNAPSIGVDYIWQTLKVKDTMEYRTRDWLGNWGNSSTGEWTEVPSGVKELKMSDLFEDGVTRGGTVEIRTKADSAKKKPASKACILKFPEAMHLLSDDFGLINKNGISGAGLPDAGLIFKLIRKNEKNYCRFINTNPEATYEIYDSDPYENKKAKKIAILKAPKKGESTEVQVSDAKVPEKATLYVLISADKKQNRFRSNAQPAGATAMLYPTEDTE